MGSNKHSPSPWEAAGSEKTTATRITDAKGKTIARTMKCETDWANCKLMAAAPDLLEWLKAARFYVERSQHVTELGRITRNRDLHMMDLAISRAEGKS